MVGLETLPMRATRLPATIWSEGFVVSCSSPMSPFSPGAIPGQRSITLAGPEARTFSDLRTNVRIKRDRYERCISEQIQLIELFGNGPTQLRSASPGARFHA